MADTAINVPVKTRTHELEQLHHMVPKVREGLENADLDEAAEEVKRVYDEHISGVTATYPEGDAFAAWVSMPAEDWRIIVRYLNRLRPSKRVEWLQKKLTGRLTERMEELE